LKKEKKSRSRARCFCWRGIYFYDSSLWDS